MAADSLVAAGKKAGVDLQVETQGSSGSTPLPPETIAGAVAVIFATDVGVKDRGRFAGKPLIASGVKRAINEPDKMVAEALAAADNPNSARVEGVAGAASSSSPSASSGVGWGTRTRQILLTGVSYMIPFVAAGGLLIALGFLFAGYGIANKPDGGTQSLGNLIATTNSLTNLPSGGFLQYLGAVLFTLGGLAFSFLVPALAGYISFAIADRPGIAPGFTAGAVAVFVGGGFIGGIVGGLIAGFTALWISRIDVPRWLRGLMPVVIIPLVASLAVGLLMFLLLGRPLAAITSGLTSWLSGLSGSSVILLGVILGLMMCFDLGGPVNKAAYAFATAGLNVADPSTLRIMAAVMAAGMVPPLAMALASTVRPGLFTEPERENGRAAWLLGASFISEGAIPFAAGRPSARHSVDDGRRCSHRCAHHGVRRHPQGTARRHLRLLRHWPPGSGSCSPWRPEPPWPRWPSWPPSSSPSPRRIRRTPPNSSTPDHSNPTTTRRITMPTKTVTVGSSIGLHARPAAVIAEAVVNAGVPVTLSVDGGEPVDAGSALMIMTLGAGNGAQVTVTSDDEAALATVADLVQQDLDACQTGGTTRGRPERRLPRVGRDTCVGPAAVTVGLLRARGRGA